MTRPGTAVVQRPLPMSNTDFLSDNDRPIETAHLKHSIRLTTTDFSSLKNNESVKRKLRIKLSVVSKGRQIDVK